MELELDDRIPGNMDNLSYEQLKELYKIQSDIIKDKLRIKLVEVLAPVMYNKLLSTIDNAKLIIIQVNAIIREFNNCK